MSPEPETTTCAFPGCDQAPREREPGTTGPNPVYCGQPGHDAEGKRQTQRRLERLSGRQGQRAAIAAAAALTIDMESLPWPVSMRLLVDQFARMTQTASEATYAQVEALQQATDLLQQWTDPDHVEARLAEAQARATAAEAAQHAAERQSQAATRQAQDTQEALDGARADHARRVARLNQDLAAVAQERDSAVAAADQARQDAADAETRAATAEDAVAHATQRADQAERDSQQSRNTILELTVRLKEAEARAERAEQRAFDLAASNTPPPQSMDG